MNAATLDVHLFAVLVVMAIGAFSASRECRDAGKAWRWAFACLCLCVVAVLCLVLYVLGSASE